MEQYQTCSRLVSSERQVVLLEKYLLYIYYVKV